MLFDHEMDLIFGALADSTRRGILARLADGEASITELAAPFKISQPAISKHLKVLERAGLIVKRKQGRENRVSVCTERVELVVDWLQLYKEQWSRQFDAMDHYLKQKKEKGNKNEHKDRS